MFRFPSMASSPRLLVLLLAWLCCVAAEAADTLQQGKSLSAPETLVSTPEGVFEAGFFPPDPKQPSRLYLGIWYRGIAPRTVVWVANRAAPATSAAPSLALTDTGELQVLDGTAANGTAAPPLLWSSNTSRAARAGATTCVYPGLRQPPGAQRRRDAVVGQLLAPDGHHPVRDANRRAGAGAARQGGLQ